MTIFMDAIRRKIALLKQSHGSSHSVIARIFSLITTESILPFAGYIITIIICYLYVFLMGNGLRAVYGDTCVYTDLAKRIAFNHSFHMDCVFDCVYPPLYSILISVAYLFREQAAIFEAIKIINILAYSSAFVPMYYLLRRYASLSRTQSFIGAILLLVNTYSLGYVIYITSEPLYIPLLVWFSWYLVDMKHLKRKYDLLLFIFLFSSIPLTKAIGNFVFPCFIGATIVRLIVMSNNHAFLNSRKLIWRSIIVVIASALIILLYNIYLRSMVPADQTDVSGGYLSQLTNPNLMKPSYWLDRTMFSCSWMLIVTGTVAVPLIISIIIRNPKIIYEDYLVPFFVFALLSTFILVPLFTAADFMGDPHQRYYDPLVFLFMVILFKYIYLFALSDLVIAGVMTLLFSVSAPPSPLFIIAGSMTSIVNNVWAVYVCIYVVAGAIFIFMLFMLYRHREYFVNLFFIMMAISIPILFYMKGNLLGPNMFSFYDANGIANEVLSEHSLNSKTEFIVDISWKQKIGSPDSYDANYFEYYKIMINIPMIPQFKELTDCLSVSRKNKKRFMVLTHQNITNAVKIVKGQFISLYIMDFSRRN